MNKRSNTNLRFIYYLMFIVFVIVSINVFLVSVKKVHIRSNTDLEEYLSIVSTVDDKILSSRGSIYDSEGVLIAQDVKTYDIICYLNENRVNSDGSNAYIDNPLYAARMLAPILDMEEKDIYSLLTSNEDLYQVELGAKGRNLSEKQVQQIKEIENLNGIDFRVSYLRNYPQGDVMSPYLIGYAQSDDSGKLIGKMGLEQYLNEELSGKDGIHSYQIDKNGYILPGMYEESVEAVNGYDVYVTLDYSIQNALDDCLDRLSSEKLASKAWGAVVEIKTGKILAWGQTPSFNPNILEFNEHLNYGSQVAYEPGSTMKSIIYSAAMDLNNYDGNALFDSSPFCVAGSEDDPFRTYGDDYYECINNADNNYWGNIPLDYGLIYSSNVATSTLLTNYVGYNNYKDYLEKYHIYTSTPVDSDGILENVGYSNFGLSPVDDLTATYGQGSTVNMLQLMQAYTAIFGNGEMIKPYYIDKIVDPNTNCIIYEGKRNVVSTPISSVTAKKMQDLLRRVVTDEKGTGRHYAIDETSVMAKTGTADFVNNGEYETEEMLNSVMIGFPYEDPTYMMYIAYESPTTIYYNYDLKPINDLVRTIVNIKNMNVIDKEENNVYEKNKMIDCLNMDVKEAVNDLNNENVVVIGDGNKVINQYPSSGSLLNANDKIFLLTNYQNIYIEDFSNYSRKELINYWNLTGLSIVIDGYGLVYDQSIEKGSLVDKNIDIIVKLKNLSDQIEEKEDQLLSKDE